MVFEWRQTAYVILTSLLGLGLFCLLRDNPVAAGGFFAGGAGIGTLLACIGRPRGNRRVGLARH